MAETRAAVLSFLSVTSEMMATPKIINFFKRRKFSHGLIKKFETEMIAFKSIVDNAEEKQCTNEDVGKWLEKLKKVADDAKDVLEKIQNEYQAVQERQGSCSSSWDLLTEELEPKLLGIREKLEDLAEDSAALGLSKAVGEKRSSEMRETTWIDELEGFYGRDADKKAIIDMLISEHDDGSKPGVIPIVGTGGLGKTTLAQHVYNDKAVEEQFKIRAWVYVSDQFDVTKLTKEIVEKVTGTACHYNDLGQLQIKLKKALNGEKFLLVLDDVWSEDSNKWEQLLTHLRPGGKGSKLVITTRSQEVAWMVRTVPTHDLRELEDEDCWKLFARHARLDVQYSTANRELREIGRKIVSKCEGLPLAVKALGGVLRRQTRAEKWTEVLQSEIWDVQDAEILPALEMSYIHLPSHLRRCFAYCAVFPQGYEFQKEELVALWMSQNFVVQQIGNQSLEKIGDMYFDELVLRSFLQHSSNSGGKPCFVMHDLVHKLARFVYGEFCSRLEDGTSWKIGKRTRHFSYEITKEDVPQKFQRIHEAPSLRSFVLAQQPRVNCGRVNPNACIDGEVIDGLLPKRKLLRVLSLSCWKIRELPNSIDSLKHMRQLDLSYTSIRLLPKAVTALFNLEILILRECFELEELPADIARLSNLCQIDLEGTKLQRMPLEMGKLKKLSKLTDFVVGGNGGSSIKELRNLRYLRGEISIRGLENVKDDGYASKEILKDKKNLKVLELEWEGDADDSSQVKEVLRRLKPHFHIECITIRGYGGGEFPNWVGDISFSKLNKMHLYGCKNCIRLPPLGQLASLEELSIHGETDAVLVAIDPEFYGECEQGKRPFSSLKTLEFKGMKKWREWSSFNGAFPLLEELKLIYCPELVSLPNQLPRLKRLVIEGCGKLDIDNLLISTCASLETIRISLKYPWIEKVISLASHGQLASLEKLVIVPIYGTARPGEKGFPSLKTIKVRGMLNWRQWSSCDGAFPYLEELELLNCTKLMSLPNLPRLKRLQIEDCAELMSSFPSSLPSLKILSIKHMLNWREWSSCYGAFLDLKELELRDCPELMSVPSYLPSLKRLRIRGCGELDFENLLSSARSTLEIIEIWGSEKVNCMSVETFPKLKELHMRNCSNLESLELTAAATTSTRDPLVSLSLTKLIICSCSKLVSFPRVGLRAPNLKSMDLSHCHNLKSLPRDMHSLLPSLKELSISDCPEIESFPDGGLPFLSSLRIRGCSSLKRRCEGEDWPKIKDIPHLFIV